MKNEVEANKTPKERVPIFLFTHEMVVQLSYLFLIWKFLIPAMGTLTLLSQIALGAWIIVSGGFSVLLVLTGLLLVFHKDE